MFHGQFCFCSIHAKIVKVNVDHYHQVLNLLIVNLIRIGDECKSKIAPYRSLSQTQMPWYCANTTYSCYVRLGLLTDSGSDISHRVPYSFSSSSVCLNVKEPQNLFFKTVDYSPQSIWCHGTLTQRFLSSVQMKRFGRIITILAE